MGPIESLRNLRQAVSARRWDQTRPFLPDAAADETIAQMAAIGRLHLAARAMRNAVKDRFGLAAAQEFDFRNIEQLLGPLSESARLLDESINGSHARVAYQLANRLPNRSADLILSGGTWRLDVHPIASLPEAVDRLASLLRRMTGEIDSRRLDLVTFRRELAIRRQPILRTIERLVTQSSHDKKDQNAIGIAPAPGSRQR